MSFMPDGIKQHNPIDTGSKGNRSYAWVEKAGIRPQYTYYWRAPVKVNK